jgi:hypothetical protein
MRRACVDTGGPAWIEITAVREQRRCYSFRSRPADAHVDASPEGCAPTTDDRRLDADQYHHF